MTPLQAGAKSKQETRPAILGRKRALVLQMKGGVTYNGHALSKFRPEVVSGYVMQSDRHSPELTVREVLDFAARCQGAGHGTAPVA